MGRTEEGLADLAAARDAARGYGECWREAERFRLQGELQLLQSPDAFAEAESSFLRAIEIGRQQQAKSLELRAALNLCRLWQRCGKRAEAHELLAGVYGWFTEGHDTADLKDARALLNDLA